MSKTAAVADDELPAEADELYAARPDTFVAARNALAKSLRADKRRDDASAVAALRRPSVASWALNQVARADPTVVTALLDTGAALQTATARAVAGKRADLRGAQDAQRRALEVVVDAAVGAIGDLGAGNVDQLRGRITNTLHAAMADEAVADLLRRGRLDEDIDPPGFGFGFGAVVIDDDEDDDEDGGEDAAAAEAEAAAQAEREAERARRRARADELEAVAAAAERAARAARADADAAKVALDELG